MSKNEMIIEISDTDSIAKIIKESYFQDQPFGKLNGNKNSLQINDELSKTTLNGLDNTTIKVSNEIIDGTMRFIVDESNDSIKLIPISIYGIFENKKYIFY
jgi:hypothetical protein